MSLIIIYMKGYNHNLVVLVFKPFYSHFSLKVLLINVLYLENNNVQQDVKVQFRTFNHRS